LVKLNSNGKVAVLWGRAETESPFFVPDYISMRLLPDSLSGDPLDVSSYAAPSGIAQDMTWQDHDSARYKGSVEFWMVYTVNFVLLGVSVLWGLKCFVGWLKYTWTAHCTDKEDDSDYLLDDEAKPSKLSKCCKNIGWGCLHFLRFLSLTMCVVGVATQHIFLLDDGYRWRRQSLNVMVWQVVHLLVVEIIWLRLIKMMKKERASESGTAMELTAVHY
jgi:hypothetical protein